MSKYPFSFIAKTLEYKKWVWFIVTRLILGHKDQYLTINEDKDAP